MSINGLPCVEQIRYTLRAMMERRNPFLHFDPAPMPPSGDLPLEVCLLRGETVESRHRVHILVCDGNGDVSQHWGNANLIFFPRSSVKLIQAVTWVSLGLDEQWKLGKKELALACASHGGEPDHVQAVASWLEKIGLSEKDLDCGAHLPYDQESAHALIRKRESPSQLHNNCSGKHAGMLTFCRCQGWDVQGYTNYDHPLQLETRKILAEFAGVDLSSRAWGIDGCGIPTYAFSLLELARSMAKLSDPRGLRVELKEAVQRLNDAIGSEPIYLGGSGSFCSKVVSETEGRVFAKVGAEGVYGAWIPQAGLGIAMKCEDGNARATEVAMSALLRELGHPLNFFSPLLRRWTGEVVGQFIYG